MICVSKCYGRNSEVCSHCGDCKHLCKAGCYWFKRNALATKNESPVSRPVEVDKTGACANSNCNKRFEVRHPLQVFCSTKCGRHVRNKNYAKKVATLERLRQRSQEPPQLQEPPPPQPQAP